MSHRYAVLLVALAAACGGGSDDGTTVDATPMRPGETCNNAQPITIPNGVGSKSVFATTVGYTEDYGALPCNHPDADQGSDRVFVVNVPPGHGLVATVIPMNAGFYPLIDIVEGDASACDAMQADCSTGTYWITTSLRVLYRNDSPAPKDAFIIVDGRQWAGDFMLDVEVDAISSTPSGQSCALAEPVTLTNGTAMLTGTVSLFGGYRNDYDPDCTEGSELGNDHVYQLTVPPGQRLQGRLMPAFPGSLYFLGGPQASCDSTCLAGAFVPFVQSWALATYDNTSAAPRDVFVVVDSESELVTQGTYSLDLHLTPAPPGETCAGAETVDLSSGSATVSGTLVSYLDDLAPTCAGFQANGPDHFYALTVPAQGTVTATVTPQASLNPGLYLLAAALSNCTTSATCVAANNTHGAGMADTLTYTNTGNAPLDVLLGVDSSDAGDEGTYTLAITVTP